MNRAVDGDVVAVRLLPESEWRKPNDKVAHEAKGEEAGDPDAEAPGSSSVALAPRTAEEAGGDAPADAPIETSGAVPTGVVVGIARRSWRERGVRRLHRRRPERRRRGGDPRGVERRERGRPARAAPGRADGPSPSEDPDSDAPGGEPRRPANRQCPWTSGRGTRPTPRGTTCARSSARRRGRGDAGGSARGGRGRPPVRARGARVRPSPALAFRREDASRATAAQGRTCGSFECAPWTRPGVGTSTTR